MVFRGKGESQDYWYRPTKVTQADQSQPGAESSFSRVDSNIINAPYGTWRAVVESAQISQKVDLMIRDRTMPELPPEWVSHEPYQSTPLAHADIGLETVTFRHARIHKCQHCQLRQRHDLCYSNCS